MCIFGGAGTPAVPPPPPEPPRLQDPAVRKAREDEKRRATSQSSANILTSPLGVQGTPLTTGKPILGV